MKLVRDFAETDISRLGGDGCVCVVLGRPVGADNSASLGELNAMICVHMHGLRVSSFVNANRSDTVKGP